MLQIIDNEKQAVSIIADSDRNSPIELPVLQILIKKKGNTFVGEALDFRFNAYSDKEKIKDAAKDIFEQISHLVVLDIIKRLKEGTIDELYVNSNPLGNKWDEYLALVRELRVNKIKKSYDNLMSISKLEQEEENKKEIMKPLKYKMKHIENVALAG